MSKHNDEELKRLAMACPQTDPLRLVKYNGTWRIRNTAGTVLAVHRDPYFPDFMAQNEAYARLVEAANPAAIVDLLARLEVAQGAVKTLQDQVTTLQADPNSWQSGYDEGRRMGTKTAYSEREQLKAENEGLRRDAERYRFIRKPNGCVYTRATEYFPGIERASGSHLVNLENLDMTIDAAMAKEQQP